MRVPRDRRSPRLPRWVWAVSGGSILATLALELAASVFTYRAWEADARQAGRVMNWTLVEHLSGGIQSWSFLALLTVLGFALARRGRRLLFAAPALAIAVTPLAIDVYHQSFGLLLPGLIGGFALLARDYGTWVYWLESGVKLALVLLPGAFVAARIKTRRNPFHTWAVAVMAIPAWLVGYYGVIYFSSSGQLEGWQGSGYLVAFFLGAAMGFDRPFWPWAIVALPYLSRNWSFPFFYANGAEYLLLIGLALLGTVTVPLGRVFQRAWQQDQNPDRSFAHTTG